MAGIMSTAKKLNKIIPKHPNTGDRQPKFPNFLLRPEAVSGIPIARESFPFAADSPDALRQENPCRPIFSPIYEFFIKQKAPEFWSLLLVEGDYRFL
jgi:hypothetical protein